MLTKQQVNHFNTFGFLLVREAFLPDEMADITREAERLLQAAKPGNPDYPDYKAVTQFMEEGRLLSHLPEDDRLYEAAGQLLGPGFVWGGSEGNQGRGGNRVEHSWHCDRIGEIDLNYRRLKMMIYLQPTRRDTGALRVIPGSHHPEHHRQLTALLSNDLEAAQNRFGVPGAELPCQALEVDPGDLVMFDHYLFHAVYGIGMGRQYLVAKYAAEPQIEAHHEVLIEHGQDASRLHQSFRNSRHHRVREMVAKLLTWEEKLTGEGG